MCTYSYDTCNKKLLMKTSLLTRLFSAVSGLHRRLLIFVVLPLILISALSIHLGLNQVSAIQEERMEMDLDLIGRAIRIPIANALMDRDYEQMQLVLESLFSIGRIYGVSILDAEGLLLASAGVTEEDLTSSSIPDAIANTGETIEDYRVVGGRDVFSHFLPIFDTNNQISGLIQLNRLASDFEEALDRLTLTAWLVWSGLSAGVIIVVLLGHYGGVGRHVDALLAHMQRIESGEQSHRARVSGPAEVRAIAMGLNRMLDSIDHSQQRILQHQQQEQKLSSQLRDTEKMAAIGRMARGIAHELGAPLNVIDARTQRLHKRISENPEGEREIEGIRAQVSRLIRTVYQLLDYSRPDTTDISGIDLCDLIRSVVDSLDPESRASGIKLQFDTPAETVHIQANSARIETTLLNLTRNAVQAANSLVQIRFDLSAQGVTVEIKDDGAGFEGTPDQLMEPFYTTKPPGEGTGLGLAISQNIVNEHGGKLTLANDSKGGCIASIYLPFDYQAPEATSA